MLYSLTYADLPDGDGGSTKYWFIKITPKYKDDAGILHHEILHTSQWWTMTLVSMLIVGIAGYFFTPVWALLAVCPFLHNDLIGKINWYKQKTEVAAYKVQLQYPPATTDLDRYRGIYAGFLSSKYGLDITKEEAVRLLS